MAVLNSVDIRGCFVTVECVNFHVHCNRGFLSGDLAIVQ